MIRKTMREHPFLSYYFIAVAFPSLLFTYLTILVISFPDMYGPGQSVAVTFYALRDTLIETYPVLFHHQDSVVLYVTAYFLMPIGAPFFFFPAAPTCAALIVTAANHGKRGLRALVRLYKPVQGSLKAGDGIRIYAILLGTIAAMTATVWLREYWFGDPSQAQHYLQHLGFIDPVTFLSSWLMALFLNQGALLEELGWRGFGLPLLTRALRKPLLAAIILGVFWTFWHFPREVPGLLSGSQSWSDLVTGQALFLISCCSMSVVAAYFVNITGGSVLPAIMLHGTFNHVGGMFSSIQEGARSGFTLDSPLMWLTLAVLLVLVVGKDLGWQKRLQIRSEDGVTNGDHRQ